MNEKALVIAGLLTLAALSQGTQATMGAGSPEGNHNDKMEVSRMVGNHNDKMEVSRMVGNHNDKMEVGRMVGNHNDKMEDFAD